GLRFVVLVRAEISPIAEPRAPPSQRSQILGAFERAGRLGSRQAESSSAVVQTRKLERLHPSSKLLAHRAEIRWPVPEDGRHHLDDVRPRKDRLDAIVWCRDAAGHRERAANLAAEDSEPAKSQVQFRTVRQSQLRPDGKMLHIDVRLKESVEYHQ